MLARNKSQIVAGDIDPIYALAATPMQRLQVALDFIHRLEPERERWYQEAKRRMKMIDRQDLLILELQKENYHLKEQMERIRSKKND